MSIQDLWFNQPLASLVSPCSSVTGGGGQVGLSWGTLENRYLSRWKRRSPRLSLSDKRVPSPYITIPLLSDCGALMGAGICCLPSRALGNNKIGAKTRVCACMFVCMLNAFTCWKAFDGNSSLAWQPNLENIMRIRVGARFENTINVCAPVSKYRCLCVCECVCVCVCVLLSECPAYTFMCVLGH